MTTIGSIYVQVKGDTTQFEKDMSTLRTQAKKSGTEVSNALNNAITPRTAAKGIQDLSVDLSRLAQSAKSSSQGFTQSATQIASGLSSVAKQAGITEAQYASMVEKMLRNRALTTATTSLKTLSNAMGLTAKESRALAIQMGYSSSQADKMAGSVKNMQSRMSGAHTTAGNFTRSIGMMTAELIGFGSAIAAAYTIKELGIAIYKTGQETLVANNAYKAITGSVQAAEKEMAFLRQTSGELGLNFYTLRDGYKGFLAAAQSSKIPMDEVQKIFRSISNASAVMGLSAEKTSLVFLALEQMMSKGKVSMEEIRRQMGDSLPGAFQIGARAMGMTVEAFDKAVSAGEVYSEDFLPKFRVAMEESFQGTIADSVRALNELAMAWEDAKNQMAQGDFMGSIVDGMREITVMLKDPDLLRGLADFTGMMGKLVALAGKYAAFQGKSFGTAMLQNEAGRLQGAGFVGAEIWDLSEDQMRSIVAYYQEVEKLSASAAEKMATNAEGAKDQVVVTTQEAKAALMTAEAELRAFMSDQSSLFPGPSYYNTLNELEDKVSDVKSKLSEQLTTDSWLIKAREEMQALLIAANAIPLDPLIQKLEADRKAINAAADAIEEDVMKRIAKTDDAKLASYKADLAAYRASGRGKKEIEIQLNADIKAIHDKRNEAAERSEKAKIREVDAALKDYFEYEKEAIKEIEEWNKTLLKSKLENIQIEEDAREEYWKNEIELMNKVVAKEKKEYEQKIKDEEKAQKKALDKQEKAFQHMYDNIHDIHAELWLDFLDGGENAFDILLKTAKKTFAQILATWSSNIMMNVLVGGNSGAAMGSGGGVLGALGLNGGGGFGVFDALSAGKTMWSAFSGGMESSAYNFLTGIGVPGAVGYTSAIAPAAASAANAAAYSGASIASAGAPSMGIAGGIASAVPYLALAAGAVMLISKLLEDDPDPYIGMQSGHFDQENYGQGSFNSKKFNFLTFAQDMGPDMSMAFRDYFDDRFTLVDDALKGALKTTLEKYSVNGPNNGWIDAEGKSAEVLLKAVSDNVFSSILEGLKLETFGTGFESFDIDFFKSLKGEQDDLFQAFVNFNAVVSNTTDFLSQFTRQVEVFGETTLDAFTNVQTISSLTTLFDLLDMTDEERAIKAVNDQFDIYVKTLENANAEVELLVRLEGLRNKALEALSPIIDKTATFAEGMIRYNKALNSSYLPSGDLLLKSIVESSDGLETWAASIDLLNVSIKSEDDNLYDFIQALAGVSTAYTELNKLFYAGEISVTEYNSLLGETLALYNQSISGITAAKNAYKDFMDSIEDYLGSLTDSTEIINLSYERAKRAFGSTLGDSGNKENLLRDAEAFREASQRYSGSQYNYQRDLGTIRRSLSSAMEDTEEEIETIDKLLEEAQIQTLSIDDLGSAMYDNSGLLNAINVELEDYHSEAAVVAKMTLDWFEKGYISTEEMLRHLAELSEFSAREPELLDARSLADREAQGLLFGQYLGDQAPISQTLYAISDYEIEKVAQVSRDELAFFADLSDSEMRAQQSLFQSFLGGGSALANALAAVQTSPPAPAVPTGASLYDQITSKATFTSSGYFDLNIPTQAAMIDPGGYWDFGTQFNNILGEMGMLNAAFPNFIISDAQISAGGTNLPDWLNLPGYADGGLASGPESGYPVMLHGDELIVPINNKQTSSHTAAEIKSLREELRAANIEIIKTNKQLLKILDRVNQGKDTIRITAVA